MGKPDPGPLKHVFDKFSQSDEGLAYWEEYGARKANQAEWDARKLYERGEGEKTDVHPSDVIQGQHTDCFLVAAMAALVQQHPEPDRWMKDVIKDNGDGSYTVTFWELKPAIPYNPMTGTAPQPAEYAKVPVIVHIGLDEGAYSDDGGEKWPAVVEKAYAQAYGGDGDKPFDKRDKLGEAMERLTGMPSTSHDPKSVSIEKMDEYLRDHHAVKVTSITGLPDLGVSHPAYAKGGLVSPFSPPVAQPPFTQQNTKLGQWHEYYVHGVDKDTGTVILHNVHNDRREDIRMPYGQFQTAFEAVRVNPIYSRERPR